MLTTEHKLLIGFALSVGAFALTRREDVQLAIADASDRLTSRGIRNNNPGNVRISNNAWRNKVPVEQNTDGVFEQFLTPFDGIRVIGLELKASERKGQRTIREVITEWAPPIENNTNAYVASVARQTGLGPEQDIAISAHLFPLTKAIIRHENGSVPYSDQLIAQALGAA